MYENWIICEPIRQLKLINTRKIVIIVEFIVCVLFFPFRLCLFRHRVNGYIVRFWVNWLGWWCLCVARNKAIKWSFEYNTYLSSVIAFNKKCVCVCVWSDIEVLTRQILVLSSFGQFVCDSEGEKMGFLVLFSEITVSGIKHVKKCFWFKKTSRWWCSILSFWKFKVTFNAGSESIVLNDNNNKKVVGKNLQWAPICILDEFTHTILSEILDFHQSNGSVSFWSLLFHSLFASAANVTKFGKTKIFFYLRFRTVENEKQLSGFCIVVWWFDPIDRSIAYLKR